MSSDDDVDWTDPDQARKRAYLLDGESFSEWILETKQVPTSTWNSSTVKPRRVNAKRLKKNTRSLINDPPYALAYGGRCGERRWRYVLIPCFGMASGWNGVHSSFAGCGQMSYPFLQLKAIGPLVVNILLAISTYYRRSKKR